MYFIFSITLSLLLQLRRLREDSTQMTLSGENITENIFATEIYCMIDLLGKWFLDIVFYCIVMWCLWFVTGILWYFLVNLRSGARQLFKLLSPGWNILSQELFQTTRNTRRTLDPKYCKRKNRKFLCLEHAWINLIFHWPLRCLGRVHKLRRQLGDNLLGWKHFKCSKVCVPL